MKSQWKCLNLGNYTNKANGRRRQKYTTPCDACANSKIKCDSNLPCSRCSRLKKSCTFKRKKRPTGDPHPIDSPENQQYESATALEVFSNTGNWGTGFGVYTLGSAEEIISKEILLPFIDIYWKWYYGNWPILPARSLSTRCQSLNPTSTTPASIDNVLCYSLSCAVAAAIANQLTFLKSDNPINFDLEHIDIDRLIQESVRARNLINYRALPSVDNILISFFQYIYYVNVEGYMDSGLLCMKEAIDIAQIFRMRHWRMKQGHSTLEMHSLSKIHYMLLISERYMCIEQNLPVCLESSLPLPTSDLDENPSLLAGFQELVKCFALVDRSFFDNLISYTTKQTNYLSASHSNWFPRRSWIKTINSKLKDIQIVHACGETQMMNVTLSKHWMRALVWNLSHENNFTTDVQPEHYLSYKHPVSIARDFLDETSSLSSFAFESNGPGLCVKLLEITCRVADSITITGDLGALPVLQTMFDLVLQYKSDITISRSIYLKVKSVLQKASSSFNEFPAFNLDLFDLQIPSIVSSPYSNLAMSRKEEQSETLHNH